MTAGPLQNRGDLHSMCSFHNVYISDCTFRTGGPILVSFHPKHTPGKTLTGSSST